jgi:hypothetical protein
MSPPTPEPGALRAIDPARPVDADDPRMAAALDALGEQIMRTPRARRAPRRRRNRRRIALAGVVVAALLAAAGPAAGGLLGIHTGLFGAPGMTESDESEFLRTNGREMPALIEEIGRHYPLPPGGSWAAAMRSVAGGEPALIQRVGVEQAVAWASICQWTDAWLTGDTQERRAATRVLERVPGWAVMREHDGGGVVELFRRIAAAAQAGKPGLLRQFRRANCV